MIDGSKKSDETQNEQNQPNEHTAESEHDEHTAFEKLRNCMPCDISVLLPLLFSGMLVISAFLTLGVICIQVWIYNCQLKEMQKSTKAATKAAKAADDSVILARENSHLDQRAWVFIQPITSDKPEEGKKFRFHVTVKNSGKTFAKNVNVSAMSDLVEKSSEPLVTYMTTAIERHIPENLLLSPNGEGSSWFESPNVQPFTQEQVAQIESGDKTLFIVGKISYLDIFNCQHWTTFCQYYVPGNAAFAVYKKYNEINTN
jgi:hypothetical protein